MPTRLRFSASLAMVVFAAALLVAGCGGGVTTASLPNGTTTAEALIAPCLDQTNVGFTTEPGKSFRIVGIRLGESPTAIVVFHDTTKHAEASIDRPSKLHRQRVGDRTELDFVDDPRAGDGGTVAVMVLGCVARATDRVEGTG